MRDLDGQKGLMILRRFVKEMKFVAVSLNI